MGKVRGSLLVTVEGMEMAHIASEKRNQAILDFLEMKTEAERKSDKFYALSDFYSHQFSYGSFYALYDSWMAFHGKDVLKPITQSTYQMLHSFGPCVKLIPVDTYEEFLGKEEPRTNAGWVPERGVENYVWNCTSWEEWHRKWYEAHPEDIIWPANQQWLPRPDRVLHILREELRRENIQLAGSDESKEIVSVFYERIMRRKGADIHAYALEIGSVVCRSNYYKEEPVLSKMEQAASGSLRRIFSIVKKGRQQFISIDCAHGMFEFHDDQGKHIGEFRFDGTHNAEAQSDHSLQCINQWRRNTR